MSEKIGWLVGFLILASGSARADSFAGSVSAPPPSPEEPAQGVLESREGDAREVDQGSMRLLAEGSTSLFNSYSRGNLDDWFHSLSGDSTRDVDAGSPSFFHFQAGFIGVFPGDRFRMGAGVGLMLASTRGLWGTKTDFGSRTELALDPRILSVPLFAKIGIWPERFYLALEPALSLAWVTGSLRRTGESDIDFTATPRMGFQLAGGLEAYLLDFLALSAKVGYRFQKADLVYRDSSSSTGYKQPLIGGEKVQADLGGAFGTVGLLLQI